MSIPGTDVRVLYVAAGHVERGGTQAYGLSEGRENIQVVEDALAYLRARRVLVAGDKPGEYLLGATPYLIPLVVIPHDLDLVDTIRAINVDYLHRPFYHSAESQDWKWGICVETHFNAPSTTAEGPMVIHGQSAVSTALGNLAAEILQGAIGLPARHLLNESKVWDNGRIGYGFINDTVPLALLVEMDELHNRERAQVVADPEQDNVYGVALARLLLQLVGIEESPADPPPEDEVFARLAALEAFRESMGLVLEDLESRCTALDDRLSQLEGA